MRQHEPETNDDSLDDQIRPEDGLVRSWMFYNGEQVRLFAALAAGFLGVLWCFLYVLGAEQGAVAMAVLVLATFSFIVWRLVDKQLREYEHSGWKKDKHSPKRDKIAIRIAIFLWLFIGISISVIFISQWKYGH